MKKIKKIGAAFLACLMLLQAMDGTLRVAAAE
ncbi:hypothetical protein M2475_000597, partial [Breznakia sp. PF5-3]|nr:hypothetical protein [Breznakia sp. PM6-1]MDF9835037.1 hypothetical protein [Breznakia sp. PF5-3]MDF9837547.1 hypothetical protein [Breznakia sp. PFB2-8]